MSQGQDIDAPLEELRQICEDYFKLWWKVESEKYDEEFELMKKEYEVAYGTQTPRYRPWHPRLAPS